MIAIPTNANPPVSMSFRLEQSSERREVMRVIERSVMLETASDMILEGVFLKSVTISSKCCIFNIFKLG